MSPSAGPNTLPPPQSAVERSRLLPLADITVAEGQTRHSDDDLNALADSLRRSGQLHPVHVRDGDMLLLAGHGRLEAARRLGWKTITAQVHPASLSPEAYELITIDENLSRLDLTPDERTAALARRAVLIEQTDPSSSAEARRRAGGQAAGRGRPKAPDRVSGPIASSNAQVAAMAGVSERTVRRARELDKNAIPDVRTALREKRISLTEARELANHHRGRQVEELHRLLARKAERRKAAARPRTPAEAIRALRRGKKIVEAIAHSSFESWKDVAELVHLAESTLAAAKAIKAAWTTAHEQRAD